MNNKSKKCTKCEETKDITEFYKKRGKCKICYKKVYANHREKRNELLKRLPNTLTKEDKHQLRVDSNFSCMLSGENERVCNDHFIPLYIGDVVLEYGVGGTTYENMLPISNTLNNSKGACNPFKWYERKGEKYKLDINIWNQTIQYMAEKNHMTSLQYQNRVNACFQHHAVKKWVETFPRNLDTFPSPRNIFRRAFAIGIVIDVAVEKYGTPQTIDYIRTHKEYIEELKKEYMVETRK